MKITKLSINNFVGIDLFEYNPGQITILEGPKGTGKSSVLEALEMAMSKNGRRTEVISHGEDEATLLIETDTGLSVDRRLRRSGNDYLKLRQFEKGISSTERELRKLLSGDIFRPLDFIGMKAKQQTDIILSMIKMDYSKEEIIDWFGDESVIDGVNTLKHTLQILKEVETRLYSKRQEINREIKSLDAQVKGISDELPLNYNGEEWRNLSLQSYYKKVSDAQELNARIEKAKAVQDNLQDKLNSIEQAKQTEIAKIELKYKEKETAINDEVADFEKQIAELQAKIKAKNQEKFMLESQQQLEIKNVEERANGEIKKQEMFHNNACKFLEENEPIDVKPLEDEAKHVEEMRNHLYSYDRMMMFKNEKIGPKKAASDLLTEQIEIARTKPSELLVKHELPLDGITVDENGLIRINGTLLDGLSDGEKLEAAFKIALQRIGELRVLCLDGFEKLNESEQRKIVALCEKNDIQAFITVTKDTESGEFEIKESL